MLLVGLSAILIWAGGRAIRSGGIMVDTSSPISRAQQPIMFWLIVTADFVVSSICLYYLVGWWR